MLSQSRPSPLIHKQSGAMLLGRLKAHVLALCVIGVVGVFYLSTIRAGHYWGDDFSLYIHHAKNIVEGIGYADTGYIYDPFFPEFSPKTYPPIYPLLLAPVYALFGLDLTPMKVEAIVFFLMALYAMFLVLRQELPARYAVAGIALIGFNPFFWDFKDFVMSDVPFLLFAYLSLFFVNRLYRAEPAVKPRNLDVALIGVLFYLAYGTRSIGIVLVPALLLCDLIRFRRPTWFAIKVTLLFGLLMAIQRLFVSGEGSYFDQLVLQPRTVLHNVHVYSEAFASLWYNGYGDRLRLALFAAVTLLALAGYVARLRRGPTILEIFPVLYMAIILVWPAYQGNRFLLPIVPLYLLYLFCGVERLSSLLPSTVARYPAIGLLALTVVAYGIAYSQVNYRVIDSGIGRPETVAMFDFVRAATRPDDIFVFWKARSLSLYTDRAASSYHVTATDQELLEYFRSIKATYLIVGPPIFRNDRKFLGRFVGRHPDRFQEVYANADFKVYRIIDTAQASQYRARTSADQRRIVVR